jgi:beta-xylosidase
MHADDAAGIAYPWLADQGDGSYRNPVLPLDYSDPDVIRVGDVFWMTASSFTATPGLPLLRSTDLVNWQLVGHALRAVPGARYQQVQPGCGVWAPALRWHAGRFWIFFPLPDEGIYATSAPAMDGPWAEPWLVAAARGWIDPCPFWDDDGSAYLLHAYAKSRAGVSDRIHIRRMAPNGRHLLTGDWEMVHAPHHPYLEGPKVHKRNGWYYVMAPGGGVPQGWQVAFRSRSLGGPWEEKIVLAQGRTAVNGPHQGAFVDTADGQWWFVHFQDAGPLGRITHLQPVDWPHGDQWPQVGQVIDPDLPGEPVARASNPLLVAGRAPVYPQSGDEFDGRQLAPEWQWHANHQPQWADLTVRPGCLRLLAQRAADGSLGNNPHLLTRKFPAQRFTATTQIELDGRKPQLAGLCIGGGTCWAALAVSADSNGHRLVLCDAAAELDCSPLAGDCLQLRVEVDGAVCHFSWALAGGPFQRLRGSFTAAPGGWMGCKVGLFALGDSGYADFRWFRFSSPTTQ